MAPVVRLYTPRPSRIKYRTSADRRGRERWGEEKEFVRTIGAKRAERREARAATSAGGAAASGLPALLDRDDGLDGRDVDAADGAELGGGGAAHEVGDGAGRDQLCGLPADAVALAVR